MESRIVPYLHPFVSRAPSRSEIARFELKRVSKAADEYAHRKHIAMALVERDLAPLFDVLQDDPFFRHIGKLYQVADFEQRLVLLEGVGPMLLECAHWQGWMQHVDLPKSDADAAEAAANRKVAEFCADQGNARKANLVSGAAPASADARPPHVAWTDAKRSKMSEESAARAKLWAATAANVEKEDWLTTKEFVQRADLSNWELRALMKSGGIPCKPLHGPDGAPTLWRKSDVAMFIAQRSRDSHPRR